MTRRESSVVTVILSATTTAWVYRIINVIGGIITLPIIIIHLGKTEFGIWVLIGQAINIIALSDLGVASSIGRFVARFRGAKDAESLARLLSTAGAVTSLIGLLVAILVVSTAAYVPGWLRVPPELSRPTQVVYLITGLSLAVQFPLRIAMGILTGHQRYGPHGVGKISEALIYLVGVLGLAALNRLNLISLAVLSAGATLFSGALLLFVAWRMTRPWVIHYRSVSWAMSKEIFGLSSSALMNTFSSLIYSEGLGLATGRLLGIEAAGLFGLALVIINNLQPLLTSICTPFATLASEWQARNQLKRLRSASNLAMRLSFGLGLSAAAGLLFYGAPILRLLITHGGWSASDFQQVGQAIALMGLGLAIGLPQLVSGSILQGIGWHWHVTYRVAIASGLSLLAGILAMSAGWGVMGAAFGWSLAWFIQGVVLLPPITLRVLKESPWKMIVSAYLPGAAVGLLVFVVAWACETWLQPDSVLRLGLGIVVCVSTGGLALVSISGRVRWAWTYFHGAATKPPL